ncbi:hypothetical protein [Massilia sp.]|uniref:hypothetical protein n=1 Tax=Massilia sp. TaxID=1882437 RepID=UPI00289B836A|nr:hypothetical protein [Massilia sp.]
MIFNTLRASLMAATLTLAAALPVQASMLTWNLSGVQFDDGTIATGSIKMDISEHAWKFDSFSFSTFNGAVSGYTYDNNSNIYDTSIRGSNGFYLITEGGDRYFNFAFTAPLAIAGGKFAIDTANSYECMNCSPYRFVTAGSLTTIDAAEIPEPGTGALLLPALAMMGWMARVASTGSPSKTLGRYR